jgi:nucleoside-diphosphate-sugar epimerase
MKKVLLIGGTGYIGSQVYKWLLSDTLVTYQVDTVDLEWYGNFVNPNNLIMDYRLLTKEQLAKYDAVILLAAFSSPAVCTNSGTAATISNNVTNFASILPKLRSGQKFIYASSITVYAGLDGELDENRPLIAPPTNSYDFSKQDCDRIMLLYPDVEFYGLRLATVCGISENWRSDIMVNAMTANAIKTNEIKVFNSQAHKPILHIYDLLRALQYILHSEKDHRGFYNLASYNGITEEIAQIVADVTNSKLITLSKDQMVAAGLPTTGYDLTVSTKKFEQTFDFKFRGTTSDITTMIVNNIDKVHATKRVDGIKYV